MSIPGPRERPDLYDGYDCQPRSQKTIENMQKNMPEHVKKALAERANKNVKVPNE